MKRLESLFGLVAALAFAATAILAVVVVGTLVMKGPAPGPTPAAAPATTSASSAPAAPVASAPAAPAAPAQPASTTGGIDLAAGERAWGQCRACHTITPGGRTGTGPNLWGIHGAPVAAVEGFNYSPALRAASGQVWDDALLEAFLTRPADAFPGNRMSYNGIRDAAQRRNLIAWISQQSDSPAPLAAGPVETAPVAAAAEVEADAPAVTEEEYQALLAAFGWMNPPARPAIEDDEARARAAAIVAALPDMDYETARFHPLHYPPASLTASNAECLACHAEILSHRPREVSPAGVPNTATIAWYQTLDTYAGSQESFHQRHMGSDFAQLTMNLQCRFCHQANDPREESPDMIVGRDNHTAPAVPEFNLRRMVNPSTTCLMCHGAFPGEVMGLDGHWLDLREDFEWEAGVNGCLSCHDDGGFRTERHRVTYLNAGNIEALARTGSSDSC